MSWGDYEEVIMQINNVFDNKNMICIANSGSFMYMSIRRSFGYAVGFFKSLFYEGDECKEKTGALQP